MSYHETNEQPYGDLPYDVYTTFTDSGRTVQHELGSLGVAHMDLEDVLVGCAD